MKLQETLKNWDGIVVNAVTDEDICDIIAAVKYNDHGDEFLVVKTNNGIYKYGWFLNRRGYPDYDDLDKIHAEIFGFITKPVLRKKLDYRSETSNTIYWYCQNEFKDDHLNIGWTRKEANKEEARRKITRFKQLMEGWMNGDTILHEEDYRGHLLQYMVVNDILEQEDMELLDSIQLASFDDYDGTAGKVKCGDIIIGDDIEYVLVRGHKLERYTCGRTRQRDVFGFDSFKLSLGQFN